MATWAKGFDFKNSGNTTRIGGIGTYGTDTAVEKIYIGLGSEPWNNAGLQITSSAINFKGSKVYHAGDKPTPADIGAATSSHTHNYAGSSSAGGNANAAVKLATARKLTIGSTGKTFDGTGDVAWSLSEIGAAAASHTHSYLPLSGGTISGSSFGPLTIKRSGSTNAASIQFSNDNGTLGSIGMSGSANTGLIRWNTDTNVSYTILDTGNYKTTITPANIGAAASSHTHNYAGSSSAGGAANSATVLATARKLTIGNTGKTFNGSADVSWSLSEIGAAAASHTHSYVPTSTGSAVTIHADSDASSTTEYLLMKAGHNELKIMSSAGGTTVTKGADKLTYNGSIVYHQGYKPSKSDVGLGSVNNWGASSSISANSTSQYATTNMVAQVRAEKANASHTHNYAGSSSAGGAATSALTCTGNSATATTSNYLASNSRMDYGWNGINYFNISGTAGSAAKANDTPTTAWWHVMRFNHANSTGFYTDLAVPFNDVSLYYKRVTSGAVQNGGWIRVLDALNYNSYAPTKTGSGASGTWGISVTGSSASCTGNAATATKLQTTRTINGTNFDGTAAITTANWGTARTITIGNTGKSVNGSGNVSWSLSEIGAAAASHTHSYAATSHNHGLLHDNFTVTLANTTTDSGWSMINSSYNGFLLKSIRTQASTPNWIVNNYGAGIAFGGSDTKGVISTAYGSPSIKFAGGNSTKPTWWIGITGNSGATYNLASLAANTANTLATARTINGTSFNGSANITTANWGTARTLTIGSTGKSVNGSGNVSWSLSEIGAAAASHTHSYLPLSGGTVSGTITTTNLAVATTATFAGQIKIISASSPNTLSLNGATNSSQAIIKFGTGSKIYSGAGETRLMVEGGIYSNGAITGASDINLKENIKYFNNSIMTLSNNDSLTKEDFYNFIKDEINFASFDYIDNKIENLETNLGFIAQEIAKTKVGSKIVIKPKEDEDNESNTYYQYSILNYITSIGIALQKSIEKIEVLVEENKILKEKLGL